ncbi:hypothetical protein Adt_42131 [Abeliophyllum distichum]|uniref:Uncharacterized protein n=1 Tax=Abeliophyllum distichum TaxID=126358 RepID=A0ABD1PQT1_9LAMI
MNPSCEEESCPSSFFRVHPSLWPPPFPSRRIKTQNQPEVRVMLGKVFEVGGGSSDDEDMVVVVDDKGNGGGGGAIDWRRIAATTSGGEVVEAALPTSSLASSMIKIGMLRKVYLATQSKRDNEYNN